MLPMLAQGANKALKDGLLVARCLADLEGVQSSPRRFESLRLAHRTRAVNGSAETPAFSQLHPGQCESRRRVHFTRVQTRPRSPTLRLAVRTRRDAAAATPKDQGRHRCHQATAQAYLASAGMPLAERLIAAMMAGESAGGDKRGKQSAALRIHGDEDYAELDLRVDDHAEPITELQRLYEVSLQRFQPFVACLAGRHNPLGELDRSRIEARVDAFHASRLRGKPS